MALFSKNWKQWIVSLGEPFQIEYLDRKFLGRSTKIFFIDDVTGNVTLTPKSGAVTVVGSLSASGGVSGPYTLTMNASAAIAAKTGVYVSGNNTVATASATDATKFPIGVTVAGAAGSGNPTLIVKSGIAKGVLTAATAGTIYYLSTTGTLTTTAPVATGNVEIIMGIALNATDLHVQIQLGPIVTHA